MLKKSLAVMICLTLLFSSISTQAINLDNKMLTDIDTHWAEHDISTLNQIGILNGSNNRANPDSFITRGEFTALVARALALTATNTKVNFGDISPNHMFFNEISKAASEGIVNGMSDGNFYPEKLITREEIMLILSRCINSKKSETLKFIDIDNNYQYMNNLVNVVSSGIISGYPDGTFKPKNNATRAESAVMIIRLMKSKNQADIAEIKAFSQKYIENDMKDLKSNITFSLGRALEEIEIRESGIDEIKKNGVSIRKTTNSLHLEDIENEGILSSARYSGDISYHTTYADDSDDTKNYKCEITIDMIYRNNSIYVYNYNLNIFKKDKINLTWEVYATPPDYAPEGVNVVSPSSFHISAENLNVESTTLTNEISFYNALTHKYVDYAKSNGYDIWPMYKTDFSLKTSNDFLNNISHRRKVIKLLTKYACKYKIDGLNFDFENIHSENRDILSKHIREVTLILHEMGLIVSADITRKDNSSLTWSMCYNRDELSTTCDYIMLMAYDEYYAGSKKAGSVASLDWTEESIKLTLNEVPQTKLVLGIPFYMRYWEVKNNKVTVSRAISMQTAYDLIQQNDVSYTWLEEDGQYKISWSKGDTVCSFWLENSDTIKKRIGLTNKYSLAGVASWRRGLEISNAWKIINNNL